MTAPGQIEHGADEIDAGEECVDRLDQPRIDVDDQRSISSDDDVH